MKKKDNIHPHFITAVDTENIKIVFDTVQQFIVREIMEEFGTHL